MTLFRQPSRRGGAVLAMLLWLVAPGGLAAADQAVAQRTVRVGVLEDNYPFSFRAGNGQIDGFAFELVREIETVMGLRFDRQVGPTDEINAAFREGQIELVQSYAYSLERMGEVDFSVPYLTMAGAVFVREGGPAIRSFEDLRGRRVLVHKGSLGETLLLRAGMADSIVLVESVEDALNRVNRGEGDATLAARLTGLAIAHQQGLDQLRALPVQVPGYEVRYCIAVRRGDSQLLAQVNEGLAVLVRTGRFDELYQEWFSRVEPEGYSIEEVLLAVALGLLLALLIALWAAIRQRRLRGQIMRQAEALRASEERYRGLFEGALDGLLVLETGPLLTETTIVQSNPAARRLLQTGSGPGRGARLRSVLVGDPVLLERLLHAAGSGGAKEFEHERPGASGWWRVSATPLGGGMLVSLRDISEQAQDRRRLKRQEERAFHTQKIEAIGTLAGGIAHDFNNLLTAIMGNTQLVLMSLPSGHPEAGSLEQVMKASRRAQQLVKQILAFSRRSEASRQWVRLAPLVEEAAGFLRSVARGTVEIEQQVARDLPPFLADPTQIHQVLMNIGSNALQAMRGLPGRLTFRADLVALDEASLPQPRLARGRYVRIEVQDTGTGMSRDVVDRIFEPFFTTKPLGEGTGLGLSVVHGIMEKHGGAVTVASELGSGTCFQLYFPVGDQAETAVREEKDDEIPRGAGETLLIVDDDASILDTVCRVVQRLGYSVSAHTRADEALADFAATPERFAFVLSDLTMPGMNGLQLAAQIRALRPRTPVALMSGYWSDADQADARRLLVVTLFQKPLTYEMIGRALASHLPRR